MFFTLLYLCSFLESDRAVVGLQSKNKPETVAVTMFFTLLYLCSFLESDRAVVRLQSKKKPETIAVTMFFTLLYLCSFLESDRTMFWLMTHVVERAQVVGRTSVRPYAILCNLPTKCY
ncbi:MAG: hypothetical protein F6J86_40900 [Symploca sp. SIO1B1]|nr:hypothetical protein [Symploca sp. SIO1B1]